MNQPNTTNRPMRPYRDSYEKTTPVDHCIVKLLKEVIEANLAKYSAEPNSIAKALDVGCGGQPFRKAIESRGFQYYGHDIIQNHAGTVQFLCAIDGRLSEDLLRTAPFDLILCTEVLEHVADWKVAFSNLATLLKPGGKLLITCPHYYVLHEEPFDYWRPTLYALHYFAGQSGLIVEEGLKIGSPWDVLGTILGNTTVYASVHKLPNRIVAKLTRIAFSLVFRLIRNGFMQKYTQLDCNTYLTNVFTITKQ